MISGRKHNLRGKLKRNTLAQSKQHREKTEGKGAIRSKYSQKDKRSHEKK